MIVSVVVAMGRNGVIGKDNQLPWRIPADLKRFKDLTMGHPIVMGRKTHQSIGRALPGRFNIILTRDASFQAKDCVIARSFEEALQVADSHKADELFCIGGVAVYASVLPFAHRLYITLIEGEFEGDTFFPQWNRDEWELIGEERREKDEQNLFNITFITYQRREAYAAVS